MVQEETINPDVLLIQAAAQGDGEAFAALFDRHHQKVYQFAYYLCRNETLADDLTQEAFTRAYERLSQFGPPWKLRTWLYRIVRNMYYDHSSKQSPILSLDPEIPVVSKDTEPELKISRAEGREFVQQVIDMLPDQHREILILREYDQLSYADIAETMKISLSYVRVMLHRARGMFQQMYEFSLLADDPRGTCTVLNDLLDGYYDQDGLTDSELKQVKKHLETCEICQQRQEELVALSAAVAMLPPILPSKYLYEGIRQKIEQRAESPIEGPPKARSSSISPVVVGGMVAVVLLGGLIGGVVLISDLLSPTGDKDNPVKAEGDSGPQGEDDSNQVEVVPDFCEGEDCFTPDHESEAMLSQGTAGPSFTPIPITPSAVCELSQTCGDGVCDARCENSDLCSADCACTDNGVCEAGEGSTCRDCSTNAAGQCGVACEGGACSSGLTCTDGICWDAAICGGSASAPGGGGSSGEGGDNCPCVWSDPCGGHEFTCAGYYDCEGLVCSP